MLVLDSRVISETANVAHPPPSQRPRINKIHQIKEALLIPPFLRGSIDGLNPEMCIIITELPIIGEGPCESSSNVDAILPDAFEDFAEVAEIVD